MRIVPNYDAKSHRGGCTVVLFCVLCLCLDHAMSLSFLFSFMHQVQGERLSYQSASLTPITQ